MSKAESSRAAASNGVKPNPNAAGGANYELPWVEKYRPVYLDDVVGNTETIERLKIIAKDGNMPHMIISGMPGIGKTTSILCLARQLLGDAYKEAVLELNASDERGIDVVRNRIKGFAQKKVTLAPGRQKLVILDEADSMTSGAQQALRRTMEIYSSTTRFAFACNQPNKIIEPLQSRCAILRYARLTDAQVVRRIMQICEAEDVKFSDDGIAALVFSAEGDMRQAINNLQSTFAGFGFVNGDNVFKVVDSPHPIKVQSMIKACHEQRIDDALTALKELWDLGYSCHDIISTMFKVTKTIDTLSEHAKLEFIKEIGFTHMRILEGVQTLLQLTYVEASETPSPHVGSWTMAPRPDRGSTISPRFGTPAWGPTESRELELMHHWCTRTSHGFPPHLVEHFKNEVGKEALRNDFLMNALFALTTLHLATETRNAVTARSYTAAALQYQQQATSGLREVLQNITPSTCNPIFTASALLAICAVVAPFLNTDIEEGNSVSEVIMPVMEIMKGTGSIISASDRWLLQGPLSGTIRSSVSRSPSVATEAFPVQELRRLNDMFTKDESDAAFGTERAHSKHHIFEDAIQKLEDASRKGISMLPWLLKVDARFLDELKKETSLAMALLMHWSVLLNRLDGFARSRSFSYPFSFPFPVTQPPFAKNRSRASGRANTADMCIYMAHVHYSKMIIKTLDIIFHTPTEPPFSTQSALSLFS
ncbi:replication factor c subunit 4 [Stemphylium lycopersici]|uniref:Replication factor c subunit 4 n=1 Tax=Stemphylium lycopersici TaxID=183478 RepID=A0A364N773_STELY|nr:replication factor c subunit 4 [Stemphylium lycopersici]RAR13175.1 replication factor c subunit 4 [Stemphylium lycopersici]